MSIGTASIVLLDASADDRAALASHLRQAGHTVFEEDGTDLTPGSLMSHQADLIILDVEVPGADGFQLCRELCSHDNAVPVIVVTARNDEIDRVLGLELGADDFVGKPYSSRELLARVKAVLRRVRRDPLREQPRIFSFNSWRFHPARMELHAPSGELVALSTSETALLLAFVQNPQTPLSRDRLLDLTKGRDSFPFDRSIDSHVSRLRRKLGDNARAPDTIKTAWGSGYIFTHPVDS
ncbi:winged helix-turn-helix domain-containing protein [Microbulbifer guangxiensis]|uniref:winged helix-turn-helix domain-containing protein n=1 Tax=Microbulbifer guangxiensis TaxID=2904249 RepID=UPI001F2BE7F6|nr:response regulator transcription factor [Microbulbifer guangxiensis]